MSSSRLRVFLERAVLFLILLATPAAAFSSATVSYSLSYDLAEPDVVAVRIELPGNEHGERVFIMPRAVPMGYSEVPYDRFLEGVLAFLDSGQPAVVTRATGSRWRVGEAGTIVRRIEYKVNVKRMEEEILSASDTSKLRANYAGLLGYSVFGYVDGLEGHDIKLNINVPSDWPVLTTLAPQAPPPEGATFVSAPDFYRLADSQVIAGPAATVRGLTGRVPLFLAAYSEADADLALLGRLVEETMAEVVDYFASAPFPHYTVFYELLQPISERHEYGFSMEHLDSCTIFLDAGRALSTSATDGDQVRTSYNLAHHMAHSWIPKRACGEGYFPFSWESAPIIDTIWLSEGFVQYAAVEIVADGLPAGERQGFRDRLIDRRFRRPLAEAPAFIRQMSLIELSRASSTKYSEDFRYGQNVFSRGAMMAMELDHRIREKTEGTKRFRDVMRFLMAWSERERRPFKVSELPDIIAQATGVDVRDILDRWMKPLTVP